MESDLRQLNAEGGERLRACQTEPHVNKNPFRRTEGINVYLKFFVELFFPGS